MSNRMRLPLRQVAPQMVLLADDEREVLTRTVLEHVRGRVPVIVGGSMMYVQ